MQKDSFISKVMIGSWIATIFMVTAMFAVTHYDFKAKHSQDTALITSQQQTIEAQETIIDVQQGLISGLVIENNDNVLELNDYKERWLEVLEG